MGALQRICVCMEGILFRLDDQPSVVTNGLKTFQNWVQIKLAGQIARDREDTLLNRLVEAVVVGYGDWEYRLPDVLQMYMLDAVLMSFGEFRNVVATILGCASIQKMGSVQAKADVFLVG